MTVQGTIQRRRGGKGLALVAALGFFFVECASAFATNSAAVQGVVRDSQGTAQMGALVQVFAFNRVAVATGFTDLHGRYAIANLIPGKYQVRASATLFLPAVKADLELHTGAQATVNLTLAALYDAATWLPGQRRQGDEAEDDWKWTLRSPVNRPMLRIIEEGTVLSETVTGEPGRASQGSRALISSSYNSGGYGTGGSRTSIAADYPLHNNLDVRVVSQSQPAAGGASLLAVGLQQELPGRAVRTVVRFQSHPELGAAGMQTLDFSNAQRISLGDALRVEFGGNVRAIHLVTSQLALQPFVRATLHPGGPDGSWTVQYRMATSAELQGFDDLDALDGDVPVAVLKNERLISESGRHQEFTAAHANRRGALQLALYHDALQQVAVAGVAAFALESARITADRATSAVRALVQGYDTNGLRLALDASLTPHLSGTFECASGQALGGDSATAVPVGTLKPHPAQSASLAVHGRVGATHARAAYRWQSGRGVTAVNPYGSGSDKAYLSFALRQPVRWPGHLPLGLDATVDVNNLLAQGYRPFISADGRTLYFTQTPRTLQAGLAFTF